MIEKYLELLGTQMQDRVTDAKGMVESVTFDAYGCVQALLKCKVSADGSAPITHWVDIKRLEPCGKRFMPTPPHFITPQDKRLVLQTSLRSIHCQRLTDETAATTIVQKPQDTEACGRGRA